MRRFAPLAVLAATLLHGSLVQAAEPLVIDVHRDTNCNCCKDWIRHFETSGFKVTDHVEADISTVGSRLGVPYGVGSCHTRMINGKFVEGHIPAADTPKLRERADPAGAAVPGMPVGSPGMEVGDRQDAYQIVGLTKGGQASILAEYPKR